MEVLIMRYSDTFLDSIPVEYKGVYSAITKIVQDCTKEQVLHFWMKQPISTVSSCHHILNVFLYKSWMVDQIPPVQVNLFYVLQNPDVYNNTRSSRNSPVQVEP